MKSAATHKLRAFVAIPEFIFETPEPLLLDSVMADAKKALKAAGFNGSKYYVAAHSLGTVIVQGHTLAHPEEYEGQILMGGSFARDKRHNDNSTGLTVVDHPVPSLIIAGTKDGLYRVSRNAETYYHHVANINPAQAGKYPVVIAEGLAHGSFMDIKYTTSHVKAEDLVADVTQQ